MRNRESKDFLLFFRQHPSPSWICKGRSLEITDVNHAAVKTLGYSRRQFLKMTMEDLLAEEPFVQNAKQHAIRPVMLRMASGRQVKLLLHVRAFTRNRRRYRQYTIPHDVPVGKEHISKSHISPAGTLRLPVNGTSSVSVNGRTSRKDKAYKPGHTAEKVVVMKELQEQLKGNEAYLEKILQAMISGVVVADADGKITYANEGAIRTLELEKREDLPAYYDSRRLKLVDENGNTLSRHQLPLQIALKYKRAVTNREAGLIVPTGELKWLSVSAAPLLDNHENVVGAVASFLDITERKRAEAQLKETSSRLSLATRSAGMGIWDWDMVRDELMLDERTRELYGFSYEKPVTFASWRHCLHPDDAKPVLNMLKHSIGGNGVFEAQYRIIRAGGAIRFIRDYGIVQWNGRGEPVRMVGICWDVTQQKTDEQSLFESEQMLRMNVKEKETLIREIHHRVKNNLQLISSIIYLKIISLKESEFRTFLENTRHRIRSIAIIHERLLQSEKLNQVDISDYLGKLLDDIQAAQEPHDREIRIEPHIERNLMPLDTSIYCGLIVNEIVTNSIKHAFKEKAHGLIKVIFFKNARRHVLQISDNGVSLPEDITPGKTDSFGMQMLDVFVKQLNGSLRIERKKGTTFTVSF